MIDEEKRLMDTCERISVAMQPREGTFRRLIALVAPTVILFHYLRPSRNALYSLCLITVTLLCIIILENFHCRVLIVNVLACNKNQKFYMCVVGGRRCGNTPLL